MSIDARLSRLSPVLTARERAVLVLKSLKDKTPEDPSWRRSMPPEQTEEFNRLIVLMNACNVYLPLYISVLHERVEQLYLRFYWYDTVLGFGLHPWKLAELVPPARRKQAEEAVNRGFPVVDLPWSAEEHRYSWTTVTDDMYKGIRLLTVSLWQEVRSVDIVIAEVAAELNGEDPMRPIMRGILEQTR